MGPASTKGAPDVQLNRRRYGYFPIARAPGIARLIGSALMVGKAEAGSIQAEIVGRKAEQYAPGAAKLLASGACLEWRVMRCD